MPIILYSANTLLAYSLSEQFYGGTHYVWCVPNRERMHERVRGPMPPTSDPFRIYASLMHALKENDRHCPQIRQNRAGLLRGAEQKFQEGLISKDIFHYIYSIIDEASLNDFSPILYVIPYHKVKDRIVLPKPSEKAGSLSVEYRIHDLKSDEFDAIMIPNDATN